MQLQRLAVLGRCSKSFFSGLKCGWVGMKSLKLKLFIFKIFSSSESEDGLKAFVKFCFMSYNHNLRSNVPLIFSFLSQIADRKGGGGSILSVGLTKDFPSFYTFPFYVKKVLTLDVLKNIFLHLPSHAIHLLEIRMQTDQEWSRLM